MSYIEQNGYFIFDGIKSSDYGVWINGGGTFDAPKRRYKDYTVPGRNGTLTIDEGVFEEIEVIYPAFIARNFPANIEAFRNQLMSRSGYVRMTDSYHPDEYYLAKYMDGLEADVLPAGVGGQFNLKFKRDPRRFLVSGETPISVSSSGSITNPTLFKSRPQIKIIPALNLISQPYYNSFSTRNGITYSDAGNGAVRASGTTTGNSNFIFVLGGRLPSSGTYKLSGAPAGTKLILFFQTPTDNYTEKARDTGSGTTFSVSEEEAQKIIRIDLNIDYPSTIDATFTPSLQLIPSEDKTVTIGSQTITVNSVGDYVIVDSEIQSCYRGVNNLNSQVSFNPNDFPVLAPGANNITYSGIGSVEITPNWYRI